MDKKKVVLCPLCGGKTQTDGREVWCICGWSIRIPKKSKRQPEEK